MASGKRILVIGAGVAGLTAIKACREENLDVVCYEKTGEYGGLWRYHENDAEGLPSVMKNTISNTSKEMSAFSDFPPRNEFPCYLHHTIVMQYLEMYAEHFDLLGYISYYQEVLELTPTDDYVQTGKWLVKVRDLRSEDAREEVFDGVMACVGHHAFPYFPTYTNKELFKGTIMHSHAYKSYHGLENLRVLVVGAGNSGGDVAAEMANVSQMVYLSTRRGAWIYPRVFKKGKPLDVCLCRRYKMLLPSSYVNDNLEKTLNKRMDHKRFGIKPFHPVSMQHPTVNDEIQSRILNGTVRIKRDIKEFTENGVIFHGEEESTPIDLVIFATGFSLKFTFLPKEIVNVGKDNKIVLYKHMFPPQLMHHTLAIMGLIQPNGSLATVFEMQSRWFVALMTEKCQLPTKEKMQESAKLQEGRRARHYVPSARHSIEANWIAYMDDIAGMFGAKPKIANMLLKDPKLFWACLFGPCLPYQYRLRGPNKWSGARDAILNYKTRLYEHMNNRKD